MIRRKVKDLKRTLEVELIPSTTWYINVRKNNPSLWTKIKNIAKRKHTHCEICNKKFGSDLWNQRDVHEVFSFNPGKSEQRLTELQVICHACHMAKHPGFMSKDTSPEGKRKLEYTIKHFCKVNSISREQYDAHLRDAFALWEDRSKQQWTVNLDFAKEYVDENEVNEII